MALPERKKNEYILTRNLISVSVLFLSISMVTIYLLSELSLLNITLLCLLTCYFLTTVYYLHTYLLNRNYSDTSHNDVNSNKTYANPEPCAQHPQKANTPKSYYFDVNHPLIVSLDRTFQDILESSKVAHQRLSIHDPASEDIFKKIVLQIEQGKKIVNQLTSKKANTDHKLSNTELKTDNSKFKNIHSINANKKLIVVIDDEDDLAEMTGDWLIGLGHEAKYFSNIHLALDFIRDHGNQINLIFTDLHMPDMNGFEVAKFVKSIDPNIPIVLLSGFIDPDLDLSLFAGQISKPYEESQIYNALSKAS